MKRALLSSREEEIANLIAEELSDDEIAQLLRIALPTVRTHLANIGKKLNPDKSRRRAIRAWVAERDRLLAATEQAKSA